ncbi:MAG: hypothetical protein RLY30_297 [Pseudomonadota bacterium]
MILFIFVLLGALWGASFLFLRIAAPEFGAALSAELRVGLAWLALWALVQLWPWAKAQSQLTAGVSWRAYALIGLLNSALPFALYGLAALVLPAGYMAILNALVPLWGGLLAIRFLQEPLRPALVIGVALAATGVSLMVQLGPLELSIEVLLGVLACMGATLCYAIAGILTKRLLSHASGYANALHSLFFAACWLLPFGLLQAPSAHPTTAAWLAVGALALASTALAYLIFFRLIRDLGPIRATSVTFLIPAFGVLWGVIFLGEPLTLGMLLGFGLVLSASVLVLRP